MVGERILCRTLKRASVEGSVSEEWSDGVLEWWVGKKNQYSSIPLLQYSSFFYDLNQ